MVATGKRQNWTIIMNLEDEEELDLSPDLGMDDLGEAQVGWW